MAGRRRMKTGYAISTWIRRAEELAAELWEYEKQRKLTVDEAAKAAAHIEAAIKTLRGLEHRG